MHVPNSLALQHSYRHLGPEQTRKAEGFLHDATEMLHMVLLTLDGPGEGREAKEAKLANVHKLMVDAVIALGRARVYLPGVRTYAVNIVTNGEPDADRELDRLHEIATQLLWQNHAVLPARTQAQPLAPEDEAQLAAVVRDLAVQAKIGQAMRHKWLVATALFSVLAPVLGLGLLVFAIASGAMAGIELTRGAAPPVLPA
ncbi:hypothetical protein ACNOYE_38620 [Nannocystaceae bacterium ST9]